MTWKTRDEIVNNLVMSWKVVIIYIYIYIGERKSTIKNGIRA